MAFFEYRSELYKKWQKKVLLISWIAAITILLLEILIFVFAIEKNIVGNDMLHYIFLRIVCPSTLNILTASIALLFFMRKKTNRMVRTYIISFASFVQCATVSIFHSYFQFLPICCILPFFLCSIFANKQLLNWLLIATVPLFLASFFNMISNYPVDSNFYPPMSFLCFSALIICSYFFSKHMVSAQEAQLWFIYGNYRKQRELIRELKIEPMTQLYNKQALYEEIDRMMELFQTGKSKPTLVLIDLDHFKSVNDLYGHLNGDFMLQKLAELIKSNISANQNAFRFGGEEFVLLFENESRENVLSVVQNIKNQLEHTKFDFAPDKHFTLSAGISSLYADWRAENWIESADTAMYKAKELGRNKIIEFESL